MFSSSPTSQQGVRSYLHDIKTISGTEFIACYLRHVLPAGLRFSRRYGLCDPAAVGKPERITLRAAPLDHSARGVRASSPAALPGLQRRDVAGGPRGPRLER